MSCPGSSNINMIAEVIYASTNLTWERLILFQICTYTGTLLNVLCDNITNSLNLTLSKFMINGHVRTLLFIYSILNLIL